MGAPLPWLGLGLSTNLGPHDRPDPHALLAEAPGLLDYVEYSAPLDVREAAERFPRFAAMLERRGELPVVFHPVQVNLWGPEPETDEALARLAEHCAASGTPWVGNDVAWWHAGGAVFPGYLYLAPPFDEAGLASCAAQASRIAARMPVPLLLENPAVLARRGPLHVLDFMARLSERTGLDLLLDVGHLWAYQLAADLPPEHGLDRFPLDRVVEIHVAGGVVARHGDRRFYLDDHPQPVRDEVLGLLAAIVPRCPRLRAVTFEGDGHPDAIARLTLERLRPLVPPRREEPVTARDPAPPAGEPRDPRAWELYEERFGARAPAEDPDGVAAERAFRRTVLAERLDRGWPLTRPVAAPWPADLDAFAASPEFRAQHDGGARSLGQAFAAWIRRRLRERPDPAVEAAFAFETLAQSLPRRDPPALRPGAAALAPGVTVGRFPLDLREALHAAGSLRRHLVGRAWATGALDHGGLEALRQAVARAVPRSFAFAARTGARLEVTPLDPPLAAVLAAASRGEPWDRFRVRTDLAPEAIERALAARLIAPVS